MRACLRQSALKRWAPVKCVGVLRGLDWGRYTAPPLLQNTMIKLCCPQAAFEIYLAGGSMFARVPAERYEAAKKELNLYTTTMHAINSIIVKCGKLTSAVKVYRGSSGAKPPDEFWQPDQFGICGGVEPGFMSTTQSRQVAVGYASGQPAKGSIVFECNQGMTSRGADISWLSQYPHEQEILFGPLTALEVIGTNAEDSMLVICVRLSVNLASPTLERVIGKMQSAHLDLLSILQTKIARESPQEVPKLLKLRAQAEAESPDFFNAAESFKERYVPATCAQPLDPFACCLLPLAVRHCVSQRPRTVEPPSRANTGRIKRSTSRVTSSSRRCTITGSPRRSSS